VPAPSMHRKTVLMSLLVLLGVNVPSLAAAATQVIDGRILWPGNQRKKGHEGIGPSRRARVQAGGWQISL